MKNKISIIRTIIVLSFVIALSACSKDNMEILSGSVWNFENYSTTSENTDIQGWVTLYKGLMTDGTLSFFEDGTYELSSPILVTQDVVETGTWELVGSNLIIFTTGGVPRNATIDKISKSELIFMESYVYLNTDPYTTKSTWTK